MAPNNIFSPSSGRPIMTPTQDITLGCYYLTANPRAQMNQTHVKLFGSKTEVIFAHDDGSVKTHDKIRLANPDLGTTVTPSLTRAGDSANTVPSSAEVAIDVRAFSVEEQRRVGAGLAALTPHLQGTSLRVERGPESPPLPPEASRDLFARAEQAAARLGMAPLRGVAVGGGSDGNWTAAVGTPTLDGLGAVGGGAHADDEHVLADSMPERAALLAELVADLLGAPS